MNNRKCCHTSNHHCLIRGISIKWRIRIADTYPILPTISNIHQMDDKSCSCTSKLVTRKCPSWGGRQLQPEFYDSGHELPVEEAFSHALPSWVFWRLTIHCPQIIHKQHTKEENKRKSGVYVSPSERSRYSSKCIISLDELILWML